MNPKGIRILKKMIADYISISTQNTSQFENNKVMNK